MKKISIILITLLSFIGIGFSSAPKDNVIIFTNVEYGKNFPNANLDIDFSQFKADLRKTVISDGVPCDFDLIKKDYEVQKDPTKSEYTYEKVTLNYKADQKRTKEIADEFKNYTSPYLPTSNSGHSYPNELDFYLVFDAKFLYARELYTCQLVAGRSGKDWYLSSPKQYPISCDKSDNPACQSSFIMC